jgi:hypothetical protein
MQGFAERAGFEPAIPFPVYTLSRRAPSTTRTPLLFNYLENGLKEINNLRALQINEAISGQQAAIIRVQEPQRKQL